MHQPEAERQHPPPLQPRPHDVLERHVENRKCDQRLDERVNQSADGASPSVAAMRVIEWATVNDVITAISGRNLPERNHQTQQEEQVINAVEDMPEAQRHKPERGMVPAGIEPDQARVARKLVRARPAWRKNRSTVVVCSPSRPERGGSRNATDPTRLDTRGGCRAAPAARRVGRSGSGTPRHMGEGVLPGIEGPIGG